MSKIDELIMYDRVYEYQKSFNKVFSDILELSNYIDKGIMVGNSDLINLINSKFKIRFKAIEKDFGKVDVWFKKYIEAMQEIENCFINSSVINNASLKEAINIYEQEL